MNHSYIDVISLTQEPNLHRLSENKWVAPGRHDGPLMGSVVIVQALKAFTEIFPDKLTHSLHVQFLRQGNAASETEYTVEVTMSGKNSCTAFVKAMQNGQLTGFLTLGAANPPTREKERWSEHTGYSGHEMDDNGTAVVAFYVSPAGFEVKKAKNNVRNFPYWFRYKNPLVDQREQTVIAAYISDQGISNSGFPDHTRAEDTVANLTLNHSVWFHHPLDFNNWSMVTASCTATANGRGVTHGYMMSETGARLATFSQEVLLMDPARQVWGIDHRTGE